MRNNFDLDDLASEANDYYKRFMNGSYDYDSFWRKLK